MNHAESSVTGLLRFVSTLARNDKRHMKSFKQYRNTVKYLESAMLQEPDNANNYYVRGSLFDQIKEADKAEKFYNKALKYNPDHTDALYNLGAMYYNQGIDIRLLLDGFFGREIFLRRLWI